MPWCSLFIARNVGVAFDTPVRKYLYEIPLPLRKDKALAYSGLIYDSVHLFLRTLLPVVQHILLLVAYL
jgi:hypothetical protein